MASERLSIALVVSYSPSEVIGVSYRRRGDFFYLGSSTPGARKPACSISGEL